MTATVHPMEPECSPAFGHLSTSQLLLRDLRTFFPSLWLIIAPVLLCPLIIWGGSEGRCAFVILLMSCYWVAEVVPLPAVALLPLVLLPVLEVFPMHRVARSYLDDTNVMMMGSMFLALAVEESNLHTRIALKLLTLVGAKPHMLTAGFMIITSFISLWISDTATTALMTPIAVAVLDSVVTHRARKRSQRAGIEYTASEPATGLDLPSMPAKDRALCKGIMLIIAHASLIGGTGTINSTGPNLIFRSTIAEFYPDEDTGISYFSWMLFAFPPMIAYMFSSWLIVQCQFLGVHRLVSIIRGSSEEKKEEEEHVNATVAKAYDNLGPITWAEKWTLFFFVLLVGLWMSSDPRVIPGWVQLFPKKMVSDSCAGMLIAFVFFAFPRQCPDFFFLRSGSSRQSPSFPRRGLLTWKAVQKRFAWSVILLQGAGIAISASVKQSGLSSLLVCTFMHHFSGLPHFVIQVLLCILVVVATEFTTNTATGSVFIPIAFSMAEKLHVHPLFFSIPAAIGPSFSFVLPMSTPPNAIVYDTKALTMWDMASSGLLLNVACVFFTVLSMNTWSWWLFDMGSYPEYALRHNNTLPC